MVYKTISVKVVIADIIRNLGLNKNNEDFSIDDFIEWIGFHLPLIGSYCQFKQKIVELCVEDYKASLPCDFYKFISLDNGYYYGDTYNSQLIGDGCDSSLEKDLNRFPFSNNSYNINFDVITTSHRNGKITVRYLAFPTDEEGFPLVPDDESFRECLFWTVAYRLAIQGYPFKSPQMRDINFCRYKQNFYTIQARANAAMPDEPMMDRLTSRWLSWGLGK